MTIDEVNDAIQKQLGNKDFMVVQFDWSIIDVAICKTEEDKKELLKTYELVFTSREFAGLYKNMTKEEFKNYCEVVRVIPGSLVKITKGDKNA